MEENKDITPTTTVATKPVETKAAKPSVMKTTADAKPVAKKSTAAKKTVTVKKTVATKAKPAVEEVKPKVEPAVKASTQKESESKSFAISGLKKVINICLEAGGIVKAAGGIILDSSIQSTKAIASIYKKAGKIALETGQNAIGETVMVAMKNQQKVIKTGKRALKDTLETLKDADLISNPLKKSKK
jgi:hypothetical protein